jgi:hypothetical protein
MPVVTEDCINFFKTLAQRFPLLGKVPPPAPRRLDEPYGTTASFLVHPPDLVQSFVFVFFPHEDEEWLQVAREAFAFEAACWTTWSSLERGRTFPAEPFVRRLPPPVWHGLADQLGRDRTPLIACHETPLVHQPGRSFPVLVRPYVPWPIVADAGALQTERAKLRTVVDSVLPSIGRRSFDDAFRNLHARHVLASSGEVVPLRWRQFHARFFGLGLSSAERRRQTTPRPTPPPPKGQRGWTRFFTFGR